MSWLFGVKAKLKAAFLLAIICIVVLANIFWERDRISHMGDSFSSIYEDRLLPSAYIFHLTDHFYQKRLIAEHSLIVNDERDWRAYAGKLAGHNQAMEELIKDFQATYLIEREDMTLCDFKRELKEYNQLEARIFSSELGQKPGESEWRELVALFDVAKEELTQLSQIQIEMGKMMMDDSEVIVANTKVFTQLEAALILIIALIIQALIFSSQTMKVKKPREYELN
jgi:hypothetical protein